MFYILYMMQHKDLSYHKLRDTCFDLQNYCLHYMCFIVDFVGNEGTINNTQKDLEVGILHLWSKYVTPNKSLRSPMAREIFSFVCLEIYLAENRR